MHIKSTPLESVVKELLQLCLSLLHHSGQFVVRKATNCATEHALFGWVTGTVDVGLREALPSIQKQLRILWSPRLLNILLFPLFVRADDVAASAAKVVMPA